MMVKACFPAHIRYEKEPIIQTVEQHCLNTAKYTAENLQGIGLKKTGYLIGIVHDCGKFTAEFSNYIWRASRGEAVRKGSVNHSFAGVKLVLDHFHQNCEKFQRLFSELISFAVGAHHGLFDCVGPDHRNGFTHRLNDNNGLYEEAISNFLTRCCDLVDLKSLFSEASREMMPMINRLISISMRDSSGGELCFYFGCLSRLLLSALIEGDRRDTTEFMCDDKSLVSQYMTSAKWEKLLMSVETKLAELPNDNDIQRARTRLSGLCRDRAASPGGIYRLNIPTGAGKTLSSLRYALAHAASNGKERIIFVSPLLSILEQNAGVIRKYLGHDDIILEHHSNVVNVDSDSELLSQNELLTESWNSPIIITTLVQLLNTMFSGKTTAIRRFQALSNSIIVVDEVQTLPPKILSMFQLAISFLAEVCGTTVLLCSATQPADQYTKHPYYKSPEPLIAYDPKIWEVFHRTILQETARCSLSDIPITVERLLAQCDSLLLVCNTKNEAAYLFHKLSDPKRDCFHLSAAMCSAHRTATLQALNASLLVKNRKTVCVSTQVIEAGVDISFACVVRMTAGMDNVVQAIGRCNRNGESEKPAPAFVLNCLDEDLSHLHEIAQAKNATEELLVEYKNNAEAFQSNLTSEIAIQYYYQRLYHNMDADTMDYPVKEHGTLFDLLASNTKYATEYSEDYGQYFLCQSFKTAGKLFSVFDTETNTILVPYGAGADIIRKIRDIRDCSNPGILRELRVLTQQAKPYSVSVFPYQIERLEKIGAIDRLCNDGILCLQPDYLGDIHYNNETGLLQE